jgi:hypothetical protein
MHSPSPVLLIILALAFSLPALAASPGPHPGDTPEPSEDSVVALWDRADTLQTRVAATLDRADKDLKRLMPEAAMHRYQQALSVLRTCVSLYGTLHDRDPSTDGKADAMTRAGQAQETIAETRDMIRLLRQMTPRGSQPFNPRAAGR